MQNQAKLDLKKLYKTQISFTEWLEAIKHKDTEEIRREDNAKRTRLAVLKQVIGIPFDQPVQFSAREISNKTEKFLDYLENHGSELCAMRLIPTDPVLPKLRMRGHTVKDVYETWYQEQNIDPQKYIVDFVPHPETTIWSTIFVVNKNGIFGEIIRGSHAQLTQGFHENEQPITFAYDFNDLRLSKDDPEALQHLLTLFKYLKVNDAQKREQLNKELSASFSHDYLEGYFETTSSKNFGIWFIDYNRILGNFFQDLNIASQKNSSIESTDNVIKGQRASYGQATGIARIVVKPTDKFEEGEVLVCNMTTPEYIPLMQKSAAIVTNLSGILSHAAIIARELKKPCVVGTKIATQSIKNGIRVIVDADLGEVTILY